MAGALKWMSLDLADDKSTSTSGNDLVLLDNKPLHEPMLTQSVSSSSVTKPQWVKRNEG